MGIDASGNMLDPVMPRFALSLSDATDLVAYLKRLGSLPEPGLDDRSLVVGTVLRPNDSAIRLVLVAYVDEIDRPKRSAVPSRGLLPPTRCLHCLPQ
jgi:hypothetical protein